MKNTFKIGTARKSVWRQIKTTIIFSIIIILISLIYFFMPAKKIIKEEKSSLRKMAVAGAFYPAENTTLKSQINNFLEVAKKMKVGKPKILIVPHAGYLYSGQVAAFAFNQLKDEDFKRVVLIGPSHYDSFKGIALSDDDFWETPLGKVIVDLDFSDKLIKENKNIFYRQESHSEEHSLEVELPFLQVALGDFKIVPIMMGEPNQENARILTQALEKYLDDQTLIIISSDLSHYPTYEAANEIDKKTIDAIISGKIVNFEKIIKESLDKNLENLATCVCGEEAIKVALLLAQDLKLKGKLLNYANSGDVTGNYLRVVGYASIFFSDEVNFIDQENVFSETERNELLKIARESIKKYLAGEKTLTLNIKSENLKQKQGAFVTLSKNGQLRGCIGKIEETAKPLYEVVSEMAVAAAFEDPRFDPVTLKELNEIEIEISVLSPLKLIKDPFKEIKVGRHGVIIKKGGQTGVFLPQVAEEENWDLEEFMNNLSESKAGLPKDAWKNGEADIYIFTAEIFGEK